MNRNISSKTQNVVSFLTIGRFLCVIFRCMAIGSDDL